MRFRLVLVVAVLALLGSACSRDADELLTNASTPVREAVVHDPLSLGEISESGATESARAFLNSRAATSGARQPPTSPIARLTSFATFERWSVDGFALGDATGTVPGDTPIWAVQYEGAWRPDGRPVTLRFAVVAIDAHTGSVVSAAAFQGAMIWPKRAGLKQPSTCVSFAPAEVRVSVGPAQAIERVRAAIPGGALSPIQTPWAPDRADAVALRCVVESTAGLMFQYGWMVSVPSEISLRDCTTLTVRQVEIKRRCWAAVAVYFVEGVTGAVTRTDEIVFTGPLLTDAQAAIVDEAAVALGWWDVWARLKANDDSIVPLHIIDSLTAAADTARSGQ